MPASSWARWRSPTSTSSRAFSPPSPSTRSPPRATPAPRWAPSPRSTTTCGCSMRAWGIRTAPTAGAPSGGRPPTRSSTRCMELPEGTKFQVLAPVVRGPQGRVREAARRTSRARGSRAPASTARSASSSEPIRLPKTYKHTIEVVVDRLVAKPDIRRRVADSIETALELAEGIATIAVQTHDGEDLQTFSQALACTHCGIATTSWRRATSPSTPRTGPAPRATASARAWRSIRSSWCPTRTSACTTARSRRGPAPRSSTGTGSSTPSARPTASISTPRGSGCRRPSARSCCTAPPSRSSCATRTATDASARTTPPSRAS